MTYKDQIEKVKCKYCEYSAENNRCPLKEQRPDNSFCEYFVDIEEKIQ